MFLRSLLPLALINGVATEKMAPTMLYSGKVITGRTLEEVYGHVQTVKSMTPRYRTSLASTKIGSDYLKHRSEEICDFPIELVIVQDATNSFEDDIVNMRMVQLQLMVDALSKTHPGSAFSLVSFRDKPLWPLGEVGDYCTRFGSPLSPNASTIIGDYAKLVVSGGGDPPESQFSSIIAAAQSSTPGWGSVPLAARLIVVVTDAAPHFEGDGFNVYNLPPFSGAFDEANNDQQCISQYYPNPFSVQSALSNRGAYLASLVYDGSYDSGLPIESWKWFNSFLGQTEGFVYDIESDSSNFWDRLSKIITELESIECGPSSTLTPTLAPTTPVPPTTLPATTPAATSVATTMPMTTMPATTMASTMPDATVTPVGTVATTLAAPSECPTCPPCTVPEGCPPCPCEGVMIKLAFRPSKLHLDVEK